ncbi:MAG: type VI secretion system-associated FHA domain protein TagH [Gammaproteobacteria bacterium]
MYLTFEVISANASQLGAHRRKVFSVDGGRIGRAPENDMVLPGVGVHRHHATVRFINGVFFVEGVGTNGIAINDPDRVLPRNEPYPLKTGDKVFIDEYEVTVTASATAPAEPAARAPERESVRPMAESTGPGARAPLVGGASEPAEDLDPLRKLTGGAPAQPRTQRPVESSWNHSSSLQDHFTPPPVPPPAAASGNVIPENWDRTSFDRSKLQPAAAPPPQRAAASPAPSAPPSHGAQRSAPPSTHAAPVGTAASSRAVPPALTQRAPAPATSNSPFDWEAFLRAAGVDASRVPPETAAIMGDILRGVVQGLIEVLRARTEIKTEFRMPVTQVKVSENNPLKFAANAEDALGNLLGRRNPAYLPPQEAFEDALNDVRFHQVAMLAGVRAGFENLMSRFDPAQLREMFDRQGKRGGLFSGKGNYWERYTERYQEMTADRDETFRRLFGEEFARAYEQQLSVLKRNRAGAQ